MPTEKYTQPDFLPEAEKLNTVLQKKSPKKLSELMSISDKLADLNWQRNQDFTTPFTPENARPAVFAFNGDVYTGLDAYNIPKEKLSILQDRLRILSGLYGVLKPLDLMQAYRLEMGTKLTVGKNKNLYEFWKKKVTAKLNEELSEDELFLNLASNEYFGAVDEKALKVPVITPVFKDWKKLLDVKEIDIVIISTPHNQLSKILLHAYKKKKHVLVEKPGVKNLKEISKVISKVNNNKIKIRVGFNHRYHPSIIKARKIIKSGVIGKPMYLRGRYGHGGRLGYEKEWRAKPSVSGGGELIDQGSHLIDLSRLFLGEFNEIKGFINTYFYKMSVEDNAFLTLKTHSNKIAFLHASWTEWKNLFSFEIFGTLGKIDISGKGGSYGQEQLILYRMTKKMEIPKQTKWKFKAQDTSWKTTNLYSFGCVSFFI